MNATINNASKSVTIPDRRSEAARLADDAAQLAATNGKTPATKKPSVSVKVPAISTDIFGSVLTINFANGKELAIDLHKLSPELQIMAGVHGLKQKLVDAAAIPRDTTTGREASIDDKYDAIKTVFERLTSPDATWNAVRDGGGKTNLGGVFLRAMCEITGNDSETMRTLLAAKTKEQTTALKQNPRVIQKMADIQLRDIGDKNASDDDLASLMA